MSELLTRSGAGRFVTTGKDEEVPLVGRNPVHVDLSYSCTVPRYRYPESSGLQTTCPFIIFDRPKAGPRIPGPRDSTDGRRRGYSTAISDVYLECIVPGPATCVARAAAVAPRRRSPLRSVLARDESHALALENQSNHVQDPHSCIHSIHCEPPAVVAVRYGARAMRRAGGTYGVHGGTGPGSRSVAATWRRARGQGEPSVQSCGARRTRGRWAPRRRQLCAAAAAARAQRCMSDNVCWVVRHASSSGAEAAGANATLSSRMSSNLPVLAAAWRLEWRQLRAC